MRKIPRQFQALLQLILLLTSLTATIWYGWNEMQSYLASTAPVPAVGSASPSPVSTATISGATIDQVRVTRVIDGDTIEIEGGQKVRYIGIDTPETKQPARVPECFGQEATAKNQQLVDQKMVHLEKDVSETDRYGRLLRYVYVDEVLINQLLVEEGYAVARSYPPDIKYQQLFLIAEQQARQSKLGLWGETCQADTSPVP